MAIVQNKGTILLIDDDKENLDVLEFLLRRRGFDTLQAYNSEEAQAVWNKHRPVIVAAVCDKWLNAAQNTSELLRGFIEEVPDLPIIVMSGDPYDDTDQKFTVRDGLNYLPKPFEPDDLFQLLDYVMEHVPH